MKTILNWTKVRYAVADNTYYFNARDAADAMCYASPKDAARKMKSSKYVVMPSTSGLKTCKVLTADQVIQYAEKRSKTLANKFRKDFDAQGFHYTNIPASEVIAPVYVRKPKIRCSFIPERYLPSEDTEETDES